MNEIEKMLESLCPDGVEFRELGEVAIKISSGGTPKTSVNEYYGGDIPWLRTQEVNFGEIWDTEIKITEKGLRNSSAKWIPKNCVIVAMYGATVGRVGINKIPMTTNQACANLELDKDILNYRYVFYYLSHQYEYIKSLGTGSQTNINAQILKKVKIPVPPLEIQEKIVKVLDIFTELEATLEATLEAELSLRKKQYEYYRNKLLTFDNITDRGGYGSNPIWQRLAELCPQGVPMVALGEVAKLKNGKDWKTLQEGDIPVYGTGGVMGFVDTYAYDKPTVLIPRKGSITNVYYLDEPFWNVDTIYYTEIDNSKIIEKFFYYFLKTVDLEKLDTGSGRPSLTQAILNVIKIPLPPLEIQQMIVDILDKFDKLVNDLTIGLPAEINARRLQYEYYRDRLLNFSQK
ncbi:hypothetical protein BKK49_08790 [Rodentibacter rarus]|uniref:restriction endonuclease subunit S n=1 Tax=Rodentibacter rarus TaxID=1908260 RepID=UPI000985F012|nr:restriction endonuclease subunit S [Rodentibacter rarus]OOF39018.1 hypothetical protein BKK49_08790 [Rodentibacter rarus]